MQIYQMLLVAEAMGVAPEVCCCGKLDDGGDATSVEGCPINVNVSWCAPREWRAMGYGELLPGPTVQSSCQEAV